MENGQSVNGTPAASFQHVPFLLVPSSFCAFQRYEHQLRDFLPMNAPIVTDEAVRLPPRRFSPNPATLSARDAARELSSLVIARRHLSKTPPGRHRCAATMD